MGPGLELRSGRAEDELIGVPVGGPGMRSHRSPILGESWEPSVVPATAPFYIYGSPSLPGRGSLLNNM